MEKQNVFYKPAKFNAIRKKKSIQPLIMIRLIKIVSRKKHHQKDVYIRF